MHSFWSQLDKKYNMETVKISAEIRTKLGKTANKNARKEGRIPGVVYGGDEVIHFSTHAKALKSLVYTSEFKLVDLEIDGKSHKSILKDIQFHPVTDNIEHVDFLRLYDDVPVTVEVPIKFEGVSPGVLEGGKLIQTVRKIKLKTTPENLVNHVVVDISNLKLGHAIRVKDITPMSGVQVMNVANTPVANVEVPRALRSELDGEADAVEEVATTEE